MPEASVKPEFVAVLYLRKRASHKVHRLSPPSLVTFAVCGIQPPHTSEITDPAAVLPWLLGGSLTGGFCVRT